MAKKVSHNPVAAAVRTPRFRAKIANSRRREIPRRAKHKGRDAA